ncbi:hypothetical protein R3W88_014398 [Solanum pinnatisectum]|uniref:F-box domain-containing protein n=1 Tax=Solanum pinnatisectum TaxID=50273 RepID=A0AAV9KUK4_9SOLN|nr:hypothetical protein R3W88_014398 [Solanum pinnatisectum]
MYRMVNMTNCGKEVIIDENEIDKISNLPTHILDEIFKDMSFLELVKTCVWSKIWKHFWATHPILVLDKEFFKELSVTAGLVEYGFSSMIDNILLRHIGLIVIFFLDLSTIYCNDKDVDYWLLCVTSKRVKELTLKNHKRKRYTLPFCIFDCPTLTYLDVTNFMVKFPPSPKALFPNLLQLTLKFIKFCPNKANYVLNTPLLSSLTFIACNGVHFLTISAPRIQFLSIHDSHDIRASFFENLSNVRELFMVLQVREESKTYEEERFITWSHLLYLCCNLTRLVLSNSCIQHLGAEIIPKRFHPKPYHLEHVTLHVTFLDLNEVSGVLSLIRSSPNLHSVEIDVVNTLSERNIDDVAHYLEDPNCVDKQFEKLEFVELRKFEGTQFENIFLKLILAYSPSLSRMIVEPSDELDVVEVLGLYEQLRMSLKASPRVKVIVAPHGQGV